MLKLKSFTPGKTPVETLIVFCPSDRDVYGNALLADLIARSRSLPEFGAESGDLLTIYEPEGLRARRVVLIGMGEDKDLTVEKWRQGAGTAVKHAIDKTLGSASIAVPDSEAEHLQTRLTALLEGGALANHIYQEYKTEKKHTPLKAVHYLLPPGKVRKLAHLPRRVLDICKGTLAAREWVTMPSNHKRPQQFVKSVRDAAQKAGLKVTVLDERQLKRKAMGAILAVAAGSDNPPALMLLEHRPPRPKATIALVGKGVTFDTGGINLKPTGSLEDMKVDMAGGAAVAAAMVTAARVKPRIHLIGAIPVVENMVSGGATRPGDVIRTYSGKTVEIGNTDAEGRLILADALAYVIEQYHPDTVVDLATLTGACVVALGKKIAGVFSPDPDLSTEIVQAGDRTHERCWPMPLPEDYSELLKSDIADLKNIGSTRWGGAITAALFLSEFVGETRWAHIDIAGPAHTKKADGTCNAGGTGFGVRLVMEWLAQV
jgi:leucyl aminopeptidase